MQHFRVSHVNIAVGDDSLYGSVTVKNGRIAAIEPDGQAGGSDIPSIDGRGGWLLPGFIDLHVHGGYGADFMDATRKSFDTITKFHASHGTTTLLATTMTASEEHISRVLEAADEYRSAPMPHARIGGVHLEGPFLSPKWMGAQNPEFRVDPRLEWLQAMERCLSGADQAAVARSGAGRLHRIDRLAVGAWHHRRRRPYGCHL